MKKVDVGIVQVSLLTDILMALKTQGFQLLQNYGYANEIENGFMQMWVDDLLEKFCKPLLAYDKDTKIILED